MVSSHFQSINSSIAVLEELRREEQRRQQEMKALDDDLFDWFAQQIFDCLNT